MKFHVGDRCYFLHYLGDELTIPVINTLVFVGKNIFGWHGEDLWYFQDVESYFEEGIYSDISDKDKYKLSEFNAESVSDLNDLNGLIEELQSLGE